MDKCFFFWYQLPQFVLDKWPSNGLLLSGCSDGAGFV